MTYTYLAADLRTNENLAELPLTVTSFSRTLNGVGTLSGSMPARLLTQDGSVRTDHIDASLPARTALYVDRDGVLVWGGIIWTRESENGVITISAQTFESYFAHRLITAAAEFPAVDQMQIVRSLVSTAQAKAGGDIGVQVGSETCGILRVKDYYDYQSVQVYRAIADLASLDYGFDWSIDVAWDGDVPTKTLTLSYPARGRTAQNTSLVLDLPGNVMGYKLTEDGTVAANTVIAMGAGEEETALRSVATSPSRIDGGYPLLETSVAYTSVAELDILDAHARADLKDVRDPVETVTVTVRTDVDPLLGSYIEGDWARIEITDERFPNGWAGYRRITQISVTPDAETAQLTLGTV